MKYKNNIRNASPLDLSCDIVYGYNANTRFSSSPPRSTHSSRPAAGGELGPGAGRAAEARPPSWGDGVAARAEERGDPFKAAHIQ